LFDSSIQWANSFDADIRLADTQMYHDYMNICYMDCDQVDEFQKALEFINSTSICIDPRKWFEDILSELIDWIDMNEDLNGRFQSQVKLAARLLSIAIDSGAEGLLQSARAHIKELPSSRDWQSCIFLLAEIAHSIRPSRIGGGGTAPISNR